MKKHNYILITGLVLTGILLAITIIAQFWTPYDVMSMHASLRHKAPSLAHLMGTDNFGRDILSRAMKGCGTTFFIGMCTVIIGAFFGTIIGAITGSIAYSYAVSDFEAEDEEERIRELTDPDTMDEDYW